MAEKTYKMIAKAGFTNPRISKGPRTTGAVLAGETFETDWLHTRELVANGLAEPAEGTDLDTEPSEALVPHSSLSVGDLAKINARREGGGEEARRGKAKEVLGRLDAARDRLAKAEEAVKARPTAENKTALEAAQSAYDAAEAEAKPFAA